MVRTSHPQRIVGHHTMPTGQHVLHDVIHGMAHMERTSDIWQRHHNHIRVRIIVRYGGKGFGLSPLLGHIFFKSRRIVLGSKFLRHHQYPWGNSPVALCEVIFRSHSFWRSNTLDSSTQAVYTKKGPISIRDWPLIVCERGDLNPHGFYPTGS